MPGNDDDDTTVKQNAIIAWRKARDEMRAAHGWLNTKWLECKALFGFHA